MANGQIKHAIGTFPNRQSAEQALMELRNTGFPMNRISVIAKNSAPDKQLGGEDTSERTLTRSEGVKVGAALGAAMGGLPVLLAGLGRIVCSWIWPCAGSRVYFCRAFSEWRRCCSWRSDWRTTRLVYSRRASQILQ